MATRSSSMSNLVDDYMHLRTVPAILSIVFALASLYQFGGIAEVHLTWGLHPDDRTRDAHVARRAGRGVRVL